MEVKHTLSDVLKRLVVDIDNMNSFLYSLENVLESKSENVNVSQTNSDGSTYSINVPSFGYLKGKIEDINTRFETLLSTNSDVIGIKSANGDVRKFELKKTSQLLQELESISTASFTLPTEFGVKNNWFFESFLNPLLYVSLDISGVLTDDIDSFVVKRLIVNSVNNDDIATFFDSNYKNRNDISLETLKLDLDANSIDYFEDDNIVDVQTAINRYKGSFDVLRILEEEVEQTLTNQTVTVVRRRYKLSSLNYTDVLSGVKNTRILAEGDTLITSNDSEYRVTTVDKTNTEVVLERIFGIDPITIGASSLRIRPVPYREPKLQINVGFNERQILFIKPISKAKNLTVDDYSTGVALYTNDLTIPLPDSTTATLENYYTNFVSDFGLILLNMAKERKLPAIVASTPTAPTLSTANFSVIQVDQHIQDDKNVTQVQNTIKEKATTEKEIQELNKKIDGIKSTITTTAKSEPEVKRLKKQLTEVQKNRDEKTVSLSTVVTNLTLQISTTPQFVVPKKYAVRGFWQIPSPVKTVYGEQNIVQFKYRYRYLSQSGNQPTAQQQTFVDADGTQRSASFSPWKEVLSKPRTKSLDATTGLYVWDTENVADSEVVNSNQLDITIRKGEIVEIQVKSLSEAGWPDNAAESAWSNSVQIPFPENISSEEESTVITQRAFADKTKIDFERSLIARGLDTHLAHQFTTGEKFFAHTAEDISSGFFTDQGNVINMYEQIKALRSTVESLQQAIASDNGVIKLSIIDPDGNTTEVANGDTINLFAGYYRDLIKDTTGGTTVYNEGRIITKQYVISIQNTSASTLELISFLFGGVDELSLGVDSLGNPIATNPNGYLTSDYHVNRRYDIVPIGVNKNATPIIGNFKQAASAQSGQVKSQYLTSRIKNYGLSEELYADTNNGSTTPSYPATGYIAASYYTSGYTWLGRTIGTTANVPANGAHYLPFDPQIAPYGSVNTKVWNGTTDSSSNGVGGGKLTEFCISKDHPSIKTLCGASYTYSVANIRSIFRPTFASAVPPTVDATAPQQYLPFSHALHFETTVQEDTNVYGVKYYKQASRITPSTPSTTTARNESHYPVKLGFKPNDEYLIGKYTCGSYLYLFPQEYDTVSVQGNFPATSSKQIKYGTENTYNIPVLFQFRCSDKLGYVGGFRRAGALNNVKYQKKIGIDINVKNDVPFSFDLEISAQYTKETSLDAPLVQGKGKISTF